MATANDIPTDLALEIGDDLDPRKFLATAKEFFALVDSIAGETATFEWRVKVRDGSNILALFPARNALPEDAQRVLDRFDMAVRSLVSGEINVAILSDAALEHARKLSDLSKVKDGVLPMRIWVSRSPILYGPDVGDSIRKETRPTYWDYGTIEGTLSAIQDSSGGLELRVKDPIWRRAIKCFLPESMLDESIRLFGQRVELFGEIHYRKDDTPDSIRINKITRLPDDDDLPTIDEVRGLFVSDLKAATG